MGSPGAEPAAPPADPPPSRVSALLSLGVRLAGGGAFAISGYVAAALILVVTIAVALVLGHRGSDALADVPGVAARFLAWGAGVTLAFGASSRAFRRDRDDGIRALLTARGASARRYVTACLGGVALVLALVVGGGTLVVGAVALGVAGAGRIALTTRGVVDAVAYALVFAATFGPFAVATLGARSRGAGYGVFLVLLVLPEVCSRYTDRLLPRSWAGLDSLPGMIAAAGSAVVSPFDGPRFARAVVALALVTIVAVGVVHAEVAATDRRSAP
jgi:hypothetical protein